MAEIALVTHEHDDDVRGSVLAELGQPSLDVLESGAVGDVIDKEGTDSASIVSASDGTVPLLAGSVPDLRFDGFAIDGDATGCKLHTDSRLGF